MTDFEILKNLNINLPFEIQKDLLKWEELFLNYNSHTNLMSKNDTKVLFEKHVYDSLAINLWEDFKNHKNILDIGTGGGFPGVILAICFRDKKIIANDSRIKKINFIKEIKESLKLDNLEVLYSRIEDVEPLNADLIVSRAVGKISDIYELSKKHLKKGGRFLIYKSKTVQNEIDEFKKKYKNVEFQTIPYELPLDENFERKLVIML
ncbi:MAG: 16S rRNA (guanine(527)-N(7))-methyltransferase RsmG [Candidatus Gastranaerophilales bacterium]|nr:16S rRNA (guanine(527)-N(7))-methyltransferase RsmG [Candidatus Gastranaerophilales bacterium]